MPMPEPEVMEAVINSQNPHLLPLSAMVSAAIKHVVLSDAPLEARGQHMKAVASAIVAAFYCTCENEHDIKMTESFLMHLMVPAIADGAQRTRDVHAMIAARKQGDNHE